MRYTLFISLFCLVFMGCSPATVSTLREQSGAQQMSASDLLTVVEGNTLFLNSHQEDLYLFFDKTGRLMGKDINNNKDSGKWDVSQAGELCLRMSKWWFGDLNCYTVYRVPDNGTLHLANPSGVLAYSAGQSEGDTKNLYVAAKTKRKSYRKSARKPQPETQLSPSSPAIPEKDETMSTLQSTQYTQQDFRSSMTSTARDCPGCNLRGAELAKANLVQAALAGADLREADLNMANLRRADLRNADLRNADLSYANLPGANLRGADLRDANLQGANLIRANLTGAQTKGASFTDALLEGTIGFK